MVMGDKKTTSAAGLCPKGGPGRWLTNVNCDNISKSPQRTKQKGPVCHTGGGWVAVHDEGAQVMIDARPGTQTSAHIPAARE